MEKRPYLKRFNSYLIDNLRITNPIYFSKQSKVKLRSLNQNERLKFLDIKSLEIIFPEMKQLLNEENQDRLKMSQFFIFFDLFFPYFYLSERLFK